MVLLESNNHLSLNLEYLDYQNRRNTWVSKKFIDLFGPKREGNSVILQKHKDLAAGLQSRLEEIIKEKK